MEQWRLEYCALPELHPAEAHARQDKRCSPALKGLKDSAQRFNSGFRSSRIT